MKEKQISIVTPCFNEGDTILRFLQQQEDVLGKLPALFNLVVVDDCSYDNTLELLRSFHFKAKNISLHVLRLKFNNGHQHAIFQGLLYTSQLKQDYTIVLDSDGEDDPRAIPLLLEQEGFDIVEVKRGKRSENLTFRILYFFYKLLFRFITGKYIDYGNYCMLSNSIVERIRLTSFIHLPAYLLKQKASRSSITFNRSKRIDGESKMGYKNLLLHAFKSFIEFGDDLLLWFLRLFIIISLLLLLTAANLVYQKFFSHTAILGWFSTLSLGLVNLAVLCLGFFIMGILMLNLLHNQHKNVTEVSVLIKKEEHEAKSI